MKSLLLTTILLVLPLCAFAEPKRVTLFPGSALVEEEFTVSEQRGENNQVRKLVLPGQAQPATLRFQNLPGGVLISDISWKARQEKNQTALETLNRKLKELETHSDSVTAELEATQSRIAFWKSQANGDKIPTLDALRELAMELGRSVQIDTELTARLQRQLKEINTELAQTRKDIENAAGRQRNVWDVQITFVDQAPQALEGSYILSDCGWEPLYRLEAIPKESHIDFLWQAKVWQRSGQNWSAVEMRLATMQPDAQGNPPELFPWEIQSHSARNFSKAMSSGARMDGPLAEMAIAKDAAPAPATQTRYSTYASWEMGKRDLPAGETRTLEIKRESWKADFTYLFRPSLDARAFVQATANFDEAQELPQGKAFFFIDGALADQRSFALAGREAKLAFGTNPLVTSETILKDKKSGEKGLLRQKQTYIRDWTTTIRNASEQPVEIRVEEPRPRPRDERIVVEQTCVPEALTEEDEPDILVWKLSLPAHGEKTISQKVTIEAPSDLPISTGWRW